MKGFRTTLVVLLLALSLSGCSANRIAPPPWVAGAECEVSDDPAENAAMAMWLGSLAVTGLALASMPRDDESALIYLTVGVIPPLVMVPSAFIVRSNGRSNAYACRCTCAALKTASCWNVKCLDSPGEGREVRCLIPMLKRRAPEALTTRTRTYAYCAYSPSNVQAAMPSVELDGTWQVAWGRFYLHGDIPSGETETLQVPSVWAVPQPYRAGGNATLGCATLWRDIELPTGFASRDLGLYLPELDSASRVYLVAEQANVSFARGWSGQL